MLGYQAPWLAPEGLVLLGHAAVAGFLPGRAAAASALGEL